MEVALEEEVKSEEKDEGNEDIAIEEEEEIGIELEVIESVEAVLEEQEEEQEEEEEEEEEEEVEKEEEIGCVLVLANERDKEELGLEGVEDGMIIEEPDGFQGIGVDNKVDEEL